MGEDLTEKLCYGEDNLEALKAAKKSCEDMINVSWTREVPVEPRLNCFLSPFTITCFITYTRDLKAPEKRLKKN